MAGNTQLPDKSRFSTADIIQEIRRLHDCVHTVGEHVNKVDSKLEDVQHSLWATKEDVAYIKGVQADVSVRLGVIPPTPSQGFEGPNDPKAKPIKPAAAISLIAPWKIIATLFGCLSGVVIAYQLLFPTVVAAFRALHAAIMGHVG